MNISVGGNIAARPKMLICYLCGREYGTKSLPIHIPQCQKKWLAEEEQKPPKERRPLPQPPESILGSGRGSGIAITSSGAYNVDALNDAAYAEWEGSLEQCPHCQRRFRPEAFKHHQKSCTATRPAKRAGTGLSAAALSNRLPPGLVSGTTRGVTPIPKQFADHSAGKAKVVEARVDIAGTSRGSRQKWSVTMTETDNCEKCHTPYVRVDAKFCSECGARRGSTSSSK